MSDLTDYGRVFLIVEGFGAYAKTRAVYDDYDKATEHINTRGGHMQVWQINHPEGKVSPRSAEVGGTP